MSITVYTTPVCPQCRLTKLKLDAQRTAYSAVDLSLPEHADAHTYVTGVLGYKAAPVVVIYDEAGEVRDSWTGFRPDKLEALA